MKDWFKARNIWGAAIMSLSDAEAGRLAKALWGYTMSGEQQNLSGAERAVFEVVKMTLAQDDEAEQEISHKRAVSGSLGGQAKVANAKNATSDVAKVANATNKNKNKSIEDDDNNAHTREIVLPEHNDIPIDNQADGVPEWVDLLTMYRIDLTPSALDELRQMQEDGASSDLICWAIERSVDANAKNWNYISRVIDRCIAAGVKTASQAEEMRKKTREEKQKAQTKPAPQPQAPKKVAAQNYTQRSYSDDFMSGFADDALEEARRLRQQREAVGA